MDCLFCKIINKELPAEVIYEDSELVCFRSIEPEAPVHLLLTPKEHVEWSQELDEEKKNLLGKLMAAAQRIAREQNIDSACKFIFNVGKTAHFAHIHLHLLGGWEDNFPMHNI